MLVFLGEKRVIRREKLREYMREGGNGLQNVPSSCSQGWIKLQIIRFISFNQILVMKKYRKLMYIWHVPRL
jgi:hypothetical protein